MRVLGKRQAVVVESLLIAYERRGVVEHPVGSVDPGVLRTLVARKIAGRHDDPKTGAPMFHLRVEAAKDAFVQYAGRPYAAFLQMLDTLGRRGA